MNNFKEKIKERFNHIDFNTMDFDQWFYQSYLPTLILKNIGEVDNNPDGSGSYDLEAMREIASYLDHLKTKVSSGFTKPTNKSMGIKSYIAEELTPDEEEAREHLEAFVDSAVYLKSRGWNEAELTNELHNYLKLEEVDQNATRQ